MLLGAMCLQAHSGGTDKKGGHHDRSYGGYHYHHGNPPHQHVDGVCVLTMRKKSYNHANNSSKQSQNFTSLVIVGILGLGVEYLFRNSNSI